MFIRSLTITMKQAAKILGCNKTTIKAWVQKGRLRTSSQHKILLSSVERMLGCRVCLHTGEEIPNLKQCEKCTLDCPRAGLTLRGHKGEVRTVINYVCHLLRDFSPPRVEESVAILEKLREILNDQVKGPKKKEEKKTKKRKRRKRGRGREKT